MVQNRPTESARVSDNTEVPADASDHPTTEANPANLGDRSNQPIQSEPTDRNPVELALAVALKEATAAGEWTTVAQLARELEARRKARSGVVELADVRARKSGGHP
ncbi:MAG: hypothetical protein QM784_00605 [Polyangiaceae bacterium]